MNPICPEVNCCSGLSDAPENPHPVSAEGSLSDPVWLREVYVGADKLEGHHGSHLAPHLDLARVQLIQFPLEVSPLNTKMVELGFQQS